MHAYRIRMIIASPFMLLMICGFLFASKVMLSKAALSAGTQPIQLGILGNLGAGLLLLPLLITAGDAIPRSPRHLALYAVLGVISFAVPTVMSYILVQRVGPAYTSTVYSLSPLLTMTFAAIIGIERLSTRRFFSVIIGFMGMVTLVQQQIGEINLKESFWVILGLLIPTSAAIGNVIRSAFWPKGASAIAFSCGTLFSSSIILTLISPVLEPPSDWIFFRPAILLWFAILVGVSALSSVMNFRLQQVGGAVVFSQLGYWGTGFGVLLAGLIYGDTLTFMSFIGVCCIIVGGLFGRNIQPALAAERSAS